MRDLIANICGAIFLGLAIFMLFWAEALFTDPHKVSDIAKIPGWVGFVLIIVCIIAGVIFGKYEERKEREAEIARLMYPFFPRH